MINKFLSDLKPVHRKILAAVVVMMIFGLFYSLLLRPTWKRSQEIDAMIEKEQETIRKNTAFLASRDNVAKEAGAFKDYFTKDVRTEEEIIAGFLKKIELLATQSGVQMSKVSPAGEDSQEDYVKYFVTMDCSGSLESLTNFIYEVNNAKELTKVEKMNIGTNAKSPDAVLASFTISKMIIGSDPSVDARKLVRVQEEKEAAKPAATPK